MYNLICYLSMAYRKKQFTPLIVDVISLNMITAQQYL